MRLSRLALITILFAAADAAAANRIVFEQDTAVHVSFTAHATRAGPLLKALGQATKVALLTSPQTENEVLVISAQDVPLSDLMSRIARVTSGMWVRENGGYRLVADLATRKQEEKEELARRMAAVRKELARRKTDGKPAQDADSDMKKTGPVTRDEMLERMASYDYATEHSPTLATDVLSLVDPAELAALESGDRVVYSTDPTPTQRRLPPQAKALIDRVIDERNALAENLEPTLRGFFPAAMPDDLTWVAQKLKSTASLKNASRGLLVVPQMDKNSGVNLGDVHLILLNGGGDNIFEADSEAPNDANEWVPSKSKVIDPANEIAYSPESRELMSAAASLRKRPIMRPDAKSALYQRLLRPDLYDPLSFVATDELFALAKAAKKPLVADVPDSFTRSLVATSYIESPASVRDSVRRGKDVTELTDERFLTLMPAAPAEARRTRLNRDALTELVQTTQSKLVSSLEDFAQYAIKTPSPNDEFVSEPYLMWMVAGLDQTLGSEDGWETVRLYGLLGPRAREELDKGHNVPLGELPAEAQAAVEHLIYGARGTLMRQKAKTENDDRADQSEPTPAFSQTEPTEVLPHGLPSGTFLSAEWTAVPFALGVAAGYENAFFDPVYDVELMALVQGSRQSNNRRSSRLNPDLPGLRMGTERQLNLMIRLTEDIYVASTLNDLSIPPDAPVVSENGLSEEFQKRIAAYLADSGSSGGTGVIPPR